MWQERQLSCASAVIALLTLVACGDTADLDQGRSSGVEASAASAPVPTGTWHRVATRAQAEALGIDPALAAEVLGSDGTLPVDLELVDDEWKLYVTSDDGSRELGDFGTWTTDDEGRWVTTSQASGCRGCQGAVRVVLDGDRMTLDIDDGDAAVTETHLIVEGTWTRRT